MGRVFFFDVSMRLRCLGAGVGVGLFVYLSCLISGKVRFGFLFINWEKVGGIKD